jgi:hypothetical protein
MSSQFPRYWGRSLVSVAPPQVIFSTLHDEMQETWLGRFFLFLMPDSSQEHYLYLQVSWVHSNQNEWIW